MKDRFINKSNRNTLLGHMDNNGIEEWKTVVLSCLEKNDWTPLIQHCTYMWITTAGSFLITTTAKLQNLKVPNVALGILTVPFLPILFYYDAHIPFIIFGSENGMFTFLIQS